MRRRRLPAQQRTASATRVAVGCDHPAGPLGDRARARSSRPPASRLDAGDARAGVIAVAGRVGLLHRQRGAEQLAGGNAAWRPVHRARRALLDIGRSREFVEVTGRARRPSSRRSTRCRCATSRRRSPSSRARSSKSRARRRLSEALRNVPGITLQAGEGGGASNTAGDMFNMRGFNASNSLFVDGVRDDGLISRDVFNLEQVEVFMGPTGSDVGRGTAAGYVNMQTKTPHARRRLLGDLSASAPPISSASDGRRQLGAVRWASTAAGSSKSAVPPERAVAGQRRARPRRSREREPGRRAVAGLGLGTPTRVIARRADRAAGQPARLRHSRRGLAGRAAGADDGPGASAGRSEQLLRQRRLRLRQGRAEQLHRARRARRQPQPDAPQPDPLQPDAPRSGDLDDPERRGLRRRRPTS